VTVALDASAVLALLADEPGAGTVEASLEGSAAMSAINFAEVVSKLAERDMPMDAIRTALGALAIHVEPFDEPEAYAVGTLRRDTKSPGLSLGDRACLALGQGSGRRVLTADRSWADLGDSLGIEITQIR
jgi:PIN domain nuclease of toxin-antitoxin system